MATGEQHPNKKVSNNVLWTEFYKFDKLRIKLDQIIFNLAINLDQLYVIQ
jgi:hypothetical protein